MLPSFVHLYIGDFWVWLWGCSEALYGPVQRVNCAISGPYLTQKRPKIERFRTNLGAMLCYYMPCYICHAMICYAIWCVGPIDDVFCNKFAMYLIVRPSLSTCHAPCATSKIFVWEAKHSWKGRFVQNGGELPTTVFVVFCKPMLAMLLQRKNFGR